MCRSCSMRRTSHALAAPGGISREQLHAACTDAVEAARRATEPALAIEAALGELHEHLGGALAAVLMLEHGRLWLVGTRGHAMIPEGLSLGGSGGACRAGGCSRSCWTSQATRTSSRRPQRSVSELALPLVTSEGVVGVLNVETFSSLPGDAAVLAAGVAATLAPITQALRSGRHVDLSTLARLFVLHLSSLRDPLAIADVVVRSLPRVLPVESTQLLLRDEAGRLVDAAAWQASDDSPEPLDPEVLDVLRERIDPSAVFELLDTEVARLPELRETRVRAAILLPLRASGEELGLLVATSRFGKEFDRTQAEAAALLAAHTAASLDAAVALGRERRSALTDPLTGLLNRRGLEEQARARASARAGGAQPAQPDRARLRRLQGRQRPGRPRVR